MANSKPKVILLLAGEGKRLRPHTLDRPKCMVEVNGLSLIDRQLKILRKSGLDDLIMIGGYKADMLKRTNVPLRINSRYYETNMVWTLFCAESDLDGDVIISYGDIVYSQDILKKLLDSKEDISVIIDKDWESYWRARSEDPLDDAETLKLRSDGAIYEIGNKPETIQEIEGQYIGLMKFSAKGLNQIKAIFYDAAKIGKLLDKSVEVSYMTDLLQAAIDKGVTVSSVIINSGWIEIDTVQDLNSKITLERLNALECID